MPKNFPTDRDLIHAIGVHTLVTSYGYGYHAVRKWLTRGIPWPQRAALKRIAGYRKIEVHKHFLERRK